MRARRFLIASPRDVWVAAAVAAVVFLNPQVGRSQSEAVVTTVEGGASIRVAAPTPGAAPAPSGDPSPAGQQPPPGAQPGTPPPMGDQKPEEKKPEEPKPATRPAEPSRPADPKELEVRPNAEGMIQFGFRGQPWPDVLQWLANISNMNLEWQEAPPGYLDFTTQRQYTVPEVRDLINSILLTRGFTLLRNGEVLMVAKVDKLDINLVPMVAPRDLDERGNYEIVRTLFDLTTLRADTLAEELKPLLSAYGKISALKTTNRLDVVETGRNLRRLRDILAEEQGASGQDVEIRQFHVNHVRAEDVVESLNSILGVEKKPSGPMTPEQMQAMQQAAQMAAQQAAQGGGGPPKKEPDIHLTVNRATNSVIAHAVPDKLAIIEKAIQYLDVPGNQNFGSPLENISRIRQYRLTGTSPDAVIKVLKDMGGLAPSTQLVGDATNRTIMATGPMVDHITIGRLVEQLNGSGREFEVIQLRRLSAEFVAGSIEFLMGSAEDDQSNNRRNFWYYPFRSDSQDSQDDGKFQVEADIENNRLLLRANKVELEEIRQLLIKLGEDPFTETDPTIRVIRSTPGEATDRLIEQIRRMWPTVGPNPLEVEPAETDVLEEDKEPVEIEEGIPTAQPTDSAQQAVSVNRHQDRRPASAKVTPKAPITLVTFPGEADGPAREGPDAVERTSEAEFVAHIPGRSASSLGGIAAEAEEAPIRVTRGPHGLIVTSRDTEALSMMMDMVDRVTSFRPKHRIFYLRHTYAKDVAWLLEDVFEDKQREENTSRGRFIYYYDYPPEEKKERGRLSSRKPVKFVPDSVTNTILVQNADEGQLAEIEELIKIYDRVEPPDSQSIRKTRHIRVLYGDANEIGEVIKDVYRDLLSPNDKALAQQNQENQKTQPLFSYYDDPSIGETDEDTRLPRFKGLLSVGIDKKSNTLVVSAPQFLLSEVEKTIAALDEAAKPSAQVYKVVQVSPTVSSTRIVEALTHVQEQSKTIGTSVTQSTTGQQQPNQQNGQQPNGQQQNQPQNGRPNGIQGS